MGDAPAQRMNVTVALSSGRSGSPRYSSLWHLAEALAGPAELSVPTPLHRHATDLRQTVGPPRRLLGAGVARHHSFDWPASAECERRGGLDPCAGPA